MVSLNIANNISDLDTVKREKTARDFTANDQTQDQLRHKKSGRSLSLSHTNTRKCICLPLGHTHFLQKLGKRCMGTHNV